MKNPLMRWMIALLCLVMVGGLSACQAGEPASQPTLTSEETQTVIIKALLSLNTQTNRMDSVTELESGEKHTTLIEFSAPDRKHIIADEVEYIVAAGQVYAKTAADQPWQITQIPASSFISSEPVTEEVLANMLETVQFVRRDTLDGKTGQEMVVLSYTSTTISGELTLHNVTELWVGAEDGLPYRMVTNGDIAAISVDPATGESKPVAAKATVTTSVTFVSDIQINPPDGF